MKFLSILGKCFFSAKLDQKDFETYRAIKENQELAPKSKKFATESIMYSIFTFLSVILLAVGVYLVVKQPLEQILFKIIIVPLLIIIAAYFIIFFFIRALKKLIYQFKLNKTAHTWVAFSLIIIPALIFIAAILLILLLATAK